MGVGGQPYAPAATTPGKDPVPIVQEAGWAPGSVWTGGKSRPHRDSIPDRPARSAVAIPTELPGPHNTVCTRINYKTVPVTNWNNYLHYGTSGTE
jgi:hypothetical protein